jgi:hypothetical protein
MDNQRLSTRRLTGLAGLGTAILFGVGNALWAFDQPDGGASAKEVVSFYTSDSSWIIAGAQPQPSLDRAFCPLRERGAGDSSRARGWDMFATAAFGGALLLVAAGLGAEASNMVGALRADDGSLTPQLGRALFEISYILGYNGAGVGMGILALATAGVVWRTRLCQSGPRSFCLSLAWRS